MPRVRALLVVPAGCLVATCTSAGSAVGPKVATTATDSNCEVATTSLAVDRTTFAVTNKGLKSPSPISTGLRPASMRSIPSLTCGASSQQLSVSTSVGRCRVLTLCARQGSRDSAKATASHHLLRRGCLVHPPPMVKAATRRYAGPAATLTTGPLRAACEGSYGQQVRLPFG
jgi:hypothetical protein